MARYEYTSWGGAIQRALLTDWEQPNKVVVETNVHLPDLEANNRALAEQQSAKDPARLLARVPMTIYERSMHEGWDNDDWTKWLNSDEAKPFRVWTGRV
jgi:hypothetical protein